MKIVILSHIDYAGSGYKLFQALKRHTDHEMSLFSGLPDNRLGHPVNVTINNHTRPEAQKAVNEADIIHFKGDWPPVDGYLGLKIPRKPIVITTSGSFFRRKQYGGIGKYSEKDYSRATLKTSFETDLLYPEYSDLWTPHPIDCDEVGMKMRNVTRPVFVHIPSSPERKRTDFVKKVFDLLHKKIDCETDLITGVSFKEAVERKKRATVYFDQFMVGFYGNSALEAMQWGIPVVCWISPMAIAQAKGQLDKCPIINEDASDPERTAERVIATLPDKAIGIDTKIWCDNRHGYKAIAKQWDKLYRSL